MRSICKKLKSVLILLAIVMFLFNSIYACRTANEILADCTDFYNKPPQQQGFISREEARLCIEKVNRLLGDIEEFFTFSTAVNLHQQSLLSIQSEFLKQRLAEATLYLHLGEREVFKLLKAQARAGYLDLWLYLSGGELENDLNLNEQQINELISILIERAEIVDQQESQISEEYFKVLKDQAKAGNLELRPYLTGGKLEGSLNECQIGELLIILNERIGAINQRCYQRPEPAIWDALQKYLSEQVKTGGNLRVEDVERLWQKGILGDYEAQFWLEVLERRDRKDT